MDAPSTTSLRAFSVAPQAQHPSGVLACWCTDPPGVIVQFITPGVATLEMGQWLREVGAKRILPRFRGERELTLMLDLTLMTDREPNARNVLMEPVKQLKSRTKHHVLIPPRNASRVYLGSLYAATALLASAGVQVDIQPSAAAAIAKYQLKAASL